MAYLLTRQIQTQLFIPVRPQLGPRLGNQWDCCKLMLHGSLRQLCKNFQIFCLPRSRATRGARGRWRSLFTSRQNSPKKLSWEWSCSWLVGQLRSLVIYLSWAGLLVSSCLLNGWSGHRQRSSFHYEQHTYRQVSQETTPSSPSGKATSNTSEHQRSHD